MTTAFAPGDRVRYNGKSSEYSSSSMIGLTGTIVTSPMDWDADASKIDWDAPHQGQATACVYTANLELIQAPVEPEVPPTDSVVKPLEAEITRLKERLGHQIVQNVEARAQHEKDIKLIGETLIEKAERHDMCSVFDDTIEELNAKLTVELPTREREYQVEFTFTQTVTVMASDADSALELAREADSYMDSDDLYEYNYDVEEA